MNLKRSLVVIALSIAALPIKATDRPTLNEKLKPLEWILGRWEGIMRAPDGARKLVYEFTPDLGGDTVIFRYHALDEDHKLIYPGICLFEWLPEANLLARTGVSQSGHDLDLLVKADDTKQIWQSSGYLSSNGKLTTQTKEFTKTDENTMTIRLYNRLIGGESQSDVTFHMKRVKGSAEEEVARMEQAWDDACIKHDIDSLREIFADDYIGTDDKGGVISKQQEIAFNQSGGYALLSSTIDDLKVRVYGDTAVATGLSVRNERVNGKDNSGKYRFTDTWVRRDGRWQIASWHGSKIP